MNVLRFSDLCAQGKVAGQRVFIRADLNVPQDDAGNITEDTRIRASVPCIQMALDAGAAVMVTSHLGRPDRRRVQARGFAGAGGRSAWANCWGARCRWCATGSTASRCKPGQVVLLENCRLNKGEKKNDPELARKMAALCDIFVHDAFGTAHRAEASTYGIAQYAKIACAGPLLAAEIDAITKALANPQAAAGRHRRRLQGLHQAHHPASRWPRNVDQLIVGGGIANTFMLAAGLKIGKSLAEADLVDEAKAVIEAMKARGAEVPIPTDVVTAKTFAADAPATVKAATRRRRRRPDPGHRPADRAQAGRAAQGGRHHRLERPGRRVRVRRLRQRHRNHRPRHRRSPSAFSIAGGGDTLAAIAKYGIEKDVGYISTGGGAFLEVLEGKTLPAFEILQKRAAGEDSRSRRPAGVTRASRSSGTTIRQPRLSTGDIPMARRATKIVATLGPASSDPELLEQMIRAGVNVVRLNFSHGTAQDHIDRATLVREAAAARRPRSGDHGRPAGPEDPRRQVRRRQGAARAGHEVRARCVAHRAGRHQGRRPGLQGAAARREGRATCCCSTTA